MQSAELARLAGVTVRALRHYHQVGVLPEPVRRRNGYREYDVHDLIRVLRITRLSSVGVPLDRMAALLDDGVSDADGLLAQLDIELARQVERLTEQRRVIAELRAHGTAPDLPHQLAPYLAVFAAAGLSEDVARLDREQAVLLAHLAGDAGMPQLVDLYERLTAPAQAPVIVAISARFAAADADSPASELDAIVDDLVAVVPVVAGSADGTEAGGADAVASAFGRGAVLLAEYLDDALNETQRVVLRRVEERLAAGEVGK